MNKSWKIAYYISTVLLSIATLGGAYLDITGVPDALAIFERLGYPAYFALIIGWAKVFGIIGIWQNKVPFLREWAYAGLFFDFTGAILSHLGTGEGIVEYGPALLHLVVLLVSYVSFRKLGKGAVTPTPVVM